MRFPKEHRQRGIRFHPFGGRKQLPETVCGEMFRLETFARLIS